MVFQNQAKGLCLRDTIFDVLSQRGVVNDVHKTSQMACSRMPSSKPTSSVAAQ
jgi:hypothetical protein